MSTPTLIICKPTRWFLLRAIAMLAMFGIFTVWFYYDAAVGYRKKNEAFFTERAFHKAVADFTRMSAENGFTAESWKEHASSQNIQFPDEPGILPRDLAQPLAWPEILHDSEKLRPLNPRALWIEYTGELGLSDKVAENHYTPRKIREQWVVFWICLVLTAGTLFILIRTLRRSIRVDDEAITDATGRRVAYEDLTLLDLRKWDTKGIAFLEYQAPSGSGRMRIDGLTYGGFRQEEDQPAERMMDTLRANFSGEILEYTSAGAADEIDGGELSDGKTERIHSEADLADNPPDAKA